jgi:conjugal transfer pilus assembly protein TraB
MQEEKDKIKDEIEEIKNSLSEAITEKQNTSNDQELEDIKSELAVLREFVMNNEEKKSNSPSLKGHDELQEEAIGIEKITFTLDEEPENKVKNIEDTIPAGAFAKAVILGGVDAATTINAQSDPKPLLVRLTDTGTLPRRFKSDLEDCHIVASSYGELSSERIYARLEKLTCIERETGVIVETQVAGYIAGEDGRVGIRGAVVEKSQQYLANSVVGGVLQGVAGILTPQQPTILSPLTGMSLNQAEANKDKFQRGFGTGAASSMDRLSKYYIERAEKIQPVIQVGAGRIVDVVFTEGSPIGTELVKKKLEKRRQKQAKEETNYETEE